MDAIDVAGAGGGAGEVVLERAPVEKSPWEVVNELVSRLQSLWLVFYRSQDLLHSETIYKFSVQFKKLGKEEGNEYSLSVAVVAMHCLFSHWEARTDRVKILARINDKDLKKYWENIENLKRLYSTLKGNIIPM